MSIRKPCTNIPTNTYSGKEQSPLRFGLSAEGFDLNTIIQGHDSMMWIVKLKNNRKVWVRELNSTSKKLIHEDPVIQNDNYEIQEISNCSTPTATILKPIVEEKKTTDYNAFLAYKLHILKQENNLKNSNKELFNKAIQEWKEIKKNPDELKMILEKARLFCIDKK
jgi:hypothetical protein